MRNNRYDDEALSGNAVIPNFVIHAKVLGIARAVATGYLRKR
jgi:hypothetical protein